MSGKCLPYTNLTQIKLQITLYKRYVMIDQQIAWHFVHYSECLSNSLSHIYATQIINPFLNSRISTNEDKWVGF